VADRQTKKQKTEHFWFHQQYANPSPIELGMVLEDLEHVFAPQKRLGFRCIVSPLGDAKNLGVTKPPQIKTPVALESLDQIFSNYNKFPFPLQCFDAVGWAAGRASGL